MDGLEQICVLRQQRNFTIYKEECKHTYNEFNEAIKVYSKAHSYPCVLKTNRHQSQADKQIDLLATDRLILHMRVVTHYSGFLLKGCRRFTKIIVNQILEDRLVERVYVPNDGLRHSVYISFITSLNYISFAIETASKTHHIHVSHRAVVDPLLARLLCHTHCRLL